jgi:hypothetical protein
MRGAILREDPMSETLVSIRPSPVHAVRWAAVLSGMAVGIAMYIVFTLAGMALGVALYSPGANPDAVPVAGAVWNVAALLVAALAGAYVAARASGLRRMADGVLHGIVTWGATTVLFAVLVSSAMGTMLGGLFGLLAPSAALDAAATERTVGVASVASGWLASAISLCLIAGMLGGAVGARGARRLMKGSRFTAEADTRPGLAEPAR